MALLSIENLRAGYGPIAVLHGVTLHVDEGEIVAVLGANGAGKSTMLRAVSRLIPASSGTITYKNKNITLCRPHAVAAMGIFSPVCAVPGLPGAIQRCLRRGDRLSFQAIACSRPPEPASRTFKGFSYISGARVSIMEYSKQALTLSAEIPIG